MRLIIMDNYAIYPTNLTTADKPYSTLLYTLHNYTVETPFPTQLQLIYPTLLHYSCYTIHFWTTADLPYTLRTTADFSSTLLSYSWFILHCWTTADLSYSVELQLIYPILLTHSWFTLHFCTTVDLLCFYRFFRFFPLREINIYFTSNRDLHLVSNQSCTFYNVNFLPSACRTKFFL